MSKQCNKFVLKLRAIVMHHFACTLTALTHGSCELPHMRLRLNVALVSICITACFRANLAVPSQPRESTRLHRIANRLAACQHNVRTVSLLLHDPCPVAAGGGVVISMALMDYHKRFARPKGALRNAFMPRSSLDGPPSSRSSPNSMLARILRARVPVLIQPLSSQAARSLRSFSVTPRTMSFPSIPVPNDFVCDASC